MLFVCSQECLEDFTKAETLGGDNQYTCQACNSKGCATKKLTLYQCPPVLVLHLKRFSVTKSHGGNPSFVLRKV